MKHTANKYEGGGSGIGLMATQALAVNGCKVYITGRTKSKLDTVVETYGKDIPGSIVAIPSDVTSKDGVKALYDEIASREKALDILINNAGVSSASLTTESDGNADEMKANLFYNSNVTNVTAQYFMTTAFLPLLQASSEREPKWSSTVLFISSISGLIKTAQHHFSYNASKAAAAHLTRMLSAELTSSNLKIRVNGIAPGVFPSEMTTDGSDEKQKSFIPAEKYKEKVPAGRAGRDEDMASAVLFAVVNQYLQGQTFAVDGGYTVAAGM
jgi:NAD(P)-dependent dehydrogenase (short-subunit alcohol dehydrogenase family)